MNRSSPSSGLMNPKPFAWLNHLTVPVAMFGASLLFVSDHRRTTPHSRAMRLPMVYSLRLWRRCPTRRHRQPVGSRATSKMPVCGSASYGTSPSDPRPLFRTGRPLPSNTRLIGPQVRTSAHMSLAACIILDSCEAELAGSAQRTLKEGARVSRMHKNGLWPEAIARPFPIISSVVFLLLPHLRRSAPRRKAGCTRIRPPTAPSR